MTIQGVSGTLASFVAQGLVKISGDGTITDAYTVEDALAPPELSDEAADNEIPYSPLGEQGIGIMDAMSAEVGDEITGQAFIKMVVKTIDSVHETDDGELAHAEGAKVLLSYKPGLGKAGAAKVAKVVVRDFLDKTGKNINTIDPSIEKDAFLDWVATMPEAARTSAIISICYGSAKGLKDVIQAYKMNHRSY